MVFCLLNDLFESGRVLYCDNFYTSPHLFEDLYEHGIFASGMVRTNSKEFPSSLVQHHLARNGFKFFYHGALTAGKWVDKRDVYFLSTLHRDKMEDVSSLGPGDVSETISKPKMGFELLTLRKGIFVDGHERPDIIESWKIFLRMMLKFGFLHFTSAPTELAGQPILADIEPLTQEKGNTHVLS